MNAIILAAGMGKRLKELTKNNTKCMVKVNGVTLIERMLRQLDKLSLGKIVIVIGYEGEKLKEYVGTLGISTEIVFVNNPVYDKTNNIYSLMLAKDHLLEDDTLLLESDLIFEDAVLTSLVNDPRPTLALVDKYESWMDGTCVRIDENDNIVGFTSTKNFPSMGLKGCYKTVNIYKFSTHFSRTHYVPFLEAYVKAIGNNEYYEQVLKVIAMLDDPEIQVKRLSGEHWYEIDNAQDLDIASSIFSESPEKLTESLMARYGGYWRYPKMVDFCYLVNPYFPPQKLMDEMKASFATLLTQYPSGMRVNSLIAADIFGVKQEHIAVGNGAAELIMLLCKKLGGAVGIIAPTFEEYRNRIAREAGSTVVFTPKNADFSYTADDIMAYFADKDIQSLIVINPDNPSGNYIKKPDVLRLCEWAEAKGITMVLDESFADFADESDNTLIDEEILAKHGRLVVVKSISKSHGVPGLRLGVMAASDEQLIAQMKSGAAIWNINSFGEFYMQIFEKYKRDYTQALEKLRRARAIMLKELENTPKIRPIPSQSNFIMAQVEGMSSSELTSRLLSQYELLIKDLSAKTDNRSFVRLAVRTEEDNARLIKALREILG